MEHPKLILALYFDWETLRENIGLVHKIWKILY